MALIAGAVTFAMLALLAIAARAHASETIYWNNYDSNSVAFANIDGTGGGALNASAAEIEDPEGIAYDPANGRFYVASSNNGHIGWVSIDGSSSGVLETGAAPVGKPEGIAVDPRTQTVYWVNDEKEGSIGYASANGGGGGELNTAGADIESPDRIALDTANERVYWVNSEAGIKGEISYANLDGTGGGNLNLPESKRSKEWEAINVDPAAGRLYLLATASGEEAVRWINLSGVGSGTVDIGGAPFKDPYGMAFDPSLGRFYWGNYEAEEERVGDFGTATLVAGGGGGIDIAAAPVDGPQDPVILKSPTGTGAPQISASSASLSCSQGEWEPDHPGSYVYAAPLSYGYQ